LHGKFRERIIESIIYTDGWCGYDGLVDIGYEKHLRVNHSKNEFAVDNKNHIIKTI